jgi:hypothetical protein
MKAYTYKDFTDKALVEGEIPEDMMDKVKKARSLLDRKCCSRRRNNPRKIL